MKSLALVLAGFLAACAFIAAGIYLFRSEAAVSTPERTVYSFTYALKQSNFARACSYVAEEVRDSIDNCSLGMEVTHAQALMFFGADLFETIHVVPGSKRDLGNDLYVFQVASEVLTPINIFVKRQENGKWRIVQTGGQRYLAPSPSQ